MKVPTVLIAVSLIAGCTSMQPIDGSPTELQQRIAAGELLEPGDRVWIETADGKAHEFVISRIDARRLEGAAESVPIDQVRYLEKLHAEHIQSPIACSLGRTEAVASLIAVSAFVAEHHFR
jgi:hypothetical protein